MNIAFCFIFMVFVSAAMPVHAANSYKIETQNAVVLPSVPKMPDIAPYTSQAVQAKIPPLQPGKVVVKNLKSSTYSKYSLSSKTLSGFSRRQMRYEPLAIEIESGVYDLFMLDQAVDPDFIVRKKGLWIMNVPVIIHPGATLVIKGFDNNVHLIAEHGVFISNFGNFFIMNAHISGWSEENNIAASYKQKDEFRPYLVSWSGSQTYLADSSFFHLGYDFAKAYGLSFSSSAPILRERPDTPPPKGWIIDCLFEGLYYGFYSYEADDVVIIDNIYRDNIIYGIDPHDRSKRLIIAHNESYGADKHGIIVSREVDDSFIFGNKSHDNKGSGIMIDRNSRRNVIAFNEITENGGDGLVFIESPDNQSWNNRIENNGRDGIRLRNSSNIALYNDKITGNAMYGVSAYTALLEDRNLVIDPYNQEVSFIMAGAQITGNARGHFNFSNVRSAIFQDVTIFEAGRMFGGDIAEYQEALYDKISIPGVSVLISKE